MDRRSNYRVPPPTREMYNSVHLMTNGPQSAACTVRKSVSLPPATVPQGGLDNGRRNRRHQPVNDKSMLPAAPRPTLHCSYMSDASNRRLLTAAPHPVKSTYADKPNDDRRIADIPVHSIHYIRGMHTYCSWRRYHGCMMWHLPGEPDFPFWYLCPLTISVSNVNCKCATTCVRTQPHITEHLWCPHIDIVCTRKIWKYSASNYNYLDLWFQPS